MFKVWHWYVCPPGMGCGDREVPGGSRRTWSCEVESSTSMRPEQKPRIQPRLWWHQRGPHEPFEDIWRLWHPTASQQPRQTRACSIWLFLYVVSESLDVSFISLFTLVFLTQVLQMLVLGLHTMKMVVRKMFQIHRSLSLHIQTVVNILSSYWFPDSAVYKKQSKELQFWLQSTTITLNSSLFPNLGTSPSPLILWSPMGSDSSVQPPSCPPSNEVWPKEEPVKIWPKEEPTDVEMQPTPMAEMPPAPLPDQSMQPPSLPDVMFASPEMWISSLPSKYAPLLLYIY